MKKFHFISIITLTLLILINMPNELKAQKSPIYEIAVRMVKDGMKNEFVSARKNFITKLKAQKGVSNDREFQSFYALPKPDEREVFIGMTQYTSMDILPEIQQQIGADFMEFAKTMDLKAYVFVQLLEGKKFDLSKLALKEGQVLEIAIRKVNAGQEKEFDESRKAFVNWLNAQEGVVGSWEFKVVGGQGTEGLTVGMSVYESQEKFQAIAGKVQTLPEAGKYFSTFMPVALQYAFSTNNQ
ncbi:MAG: hypothetical protein EAZ55_09945 [Cytophagales bacterium]|nr:MAG: hypothetical protein EAZ55_09945 [Cytophagales bacterium]